MQWSCTIMTTSAGLQVLSNDWAETALDTLDPSSRPVDAHAHHHHYTIITTILAASGQARSGPCCPPPQQGDCSQPKPITVIKTDLGPVTPPSLNKVVAPSPNKGQRLKQTWSALLPQQQSARVWL
eukprot:361885-Chlamydomonas_euryale.AAC.4